MGQAGADRGPAAGASGRGVHAPHIHHAPSTGVERRWRGCSRFPQTHNHTHTHTQIHNGTHAHIYTHPDPLLTAHQETKLTYTHSHIQTCPPHTHTHTTHMGARTHTHSGSLVRNSWRGILHFGVLAPPRVHHWNCQPAQG